MSHRRGFTLIELLVVIAIIGVLSAVVLSALDTARSKGNDAAVKSNISSIQSQAELFYDNNGNSYNTDKATGVAGVTCPTSGNTMFGADATMKGIITAASAASGNLAKCYMSTNGQTYAVEVPLKTSATTYWCVDNNGQATSTLIVFSGTTTKCGT